MAYRIGPYIKLRDSLLVVILPYYVHVKMCTQLLKMLMHFWRHATK